MEAIFIIIGVCALGLFAYFFQSMKERKSMYFNIKKKLEDDLAQAKFSGNWRKEQEINLQLLWLKIIKIIESNDIYGGKKQENELLSSLAELSEDEIKFPNRWILDDAYHFPFSQEIIAGYGKTLAENDYKGLYKPESILPFPKDIIKKAILFTFDYLNYDKPLYEIQDKKKVADNLNFTKLILLENFVDTSKIDLPKDVIENLHIGRKLREKQPYKEEDDLRLIDWRSDMDWLVEAVKYGDNIKSKYGLLDYAPVCIEMAKGINPNNKDISAVEGILYFYMAKYYEENGEEKYADNYMKKAADLDNKEALEWLRNKTQ